MFLFRALFFVRKLCTVVSATVSFTRVALPPAIELSIEKSGSDPETKQIKTCC